jgi:hypothetical protein
MVIAGNETVAGHIAVEGNALVGGNTVLKGSFTCNEVMQGGGGTSLQTLTLAIPQGATTFDTLIPTDLFMITLGGFQNMTTCLLVNTFLNPTWQIQCKEAITGQHMVVTLVLWPKNWFSSSTDLSNK